MPGRDQLHQDPRCLPAGFHFCVWGPGFRFWGVGNGIRLSDQYLPVCSSIWPYMRVSSLRVRARHAHLFRDMHTCSETCTPIPSLRARARTHTHTHANTHTNTRTHTHNAGVKVYAICAAAVEWVGLRHVSQPLTLPLPLSKPRVRRVMPDDPYSLSLSRSLSRSLSLARALSRSLSLSLSLSTMIGYDDMVTRYHDRIE